MAETVIQNDCIDRTCQVLPEGGFGNLRAIDFYSRGPGGAVFGTKTATDMSTI